jgi:chorismate mutase
MGQVRVRGLRGATTVAADQPALILDATSELLHVLLERNGLAATDVISAIFSVTPDLASEFPARAAREAGWEDVPLLCMTEIPVPGALPLCIRALLHVETPADAPAMRHAYLRGAVALRPDLPRD